MNVLVTGGTGFIGRALCAALLAAGHRVTVLSRSPKSVAQKCGATVCAMASLDGWRADQRFDAVINLAGEPIVDAAWTSARKQQLLDSRIALTDKLVACIARAAHKPAVLLSGSAIGYYGDAGDKSLDESSMPAGDFPAQLCVAWEKAALAAEAQGVRVCLLRTGLVLDASGGMLGKLLLPAKLGLGARLGSGRQWMSWIHREDWIGIALWLLADSAARGAYNLTAPAPVSNVVFTRTLGRVLHRPAVLAVPAVVLKLALGERAPMLLGGQRVLPVRIQTAGYRFRHPTLEGALRACTASS